MKPSNALSFVIIPLALGACTTSGNSLLIFESFLTTDAGKAYKLPAVGVAGDYDSDGDGTNIVVGATQGPEDEDVIIGYDKADEVNDFEVRVPDAGGGVARASNGLELNANDLAGFTLEAAGSGMYFAGLSVKGDKIAIVADPETNGYDYQTFGAWATGVNTSSGRFGAVSAGAPTPVAGIPAMTDAMYAGTSTGLWVDPTGDGYVTVADFSADVNFVAGDIIVGTSNTLAAPILGAGAFMAASNLNFIGVGVGTVVGNSFTADLVATDLAGTMGGVAYGPNAEELGGAFTMEGAGGSYVGAVGGVR